MRCILAHNSCNDATRCRNQVGLCREALASEVAQHKAVQQLASMFCKLVGENLGSKWFQHFEAWLFSRRGSRCCTGCHSILPVEAASHHAQQELQRKLVATGMAKALAESICVELNRLPAHLHGKVSFGWCLLFLCLLYLHRFAPITGCGMQFPPMTKS
jgi:hypothetical protein